MENKTTVVYFEGSKMTEVAPSNKTKAIFDEFQELAKEGECFLTQKKIGPNRYQYRATKRRMEAAPHLTWWRT